MSEEFMSLDDFVKNVNIKQLKQNYAQAIQVQDQILAKVAKEHPEVVTILDIQSSASLRAIQHVEKLKLQGDAVDMDSLKITVLVMMQQVESWMTCIKMVHALGVFDDGNPLEIIAMIIANLTETEDDDDDQPTPDGFHPSMN